MTDRVGEQKQKIRAAQEELMTAGPVHARDLRRRIARLKKELKIYIAYQAKAKEGSA